MSAWPVQDAKARFSELLDGCISEGPQVARRGVKIAVLVPIAEWKRLSNAAHPPSSPCCCPILPARTLNCLGADRLDGGL